MMFIASLIIASVSTFLILHGEYEDGVFGRIALVVLALSNAIVVTDYLIDGTEYAVLPNTLATQLGTALFLVRHCYRFMKWRTAGEYQWRPARKG
jgi:hypothetical protein